MESNKKSIRLFTLAMINVAAICNIANLPLAAKYGTTIIFFYLLATLFFFVPVALVSAELATGWPQRGGVYIWVREGLGPKMGFVAIWLQWIENVIWYPTVLSFLGATFAYIFNPTLALNKFYIMSVVIIVFWSITFVNFLGMQISGWISTICSMIGQILPGTLIIILAFFWIIKGHPVHLNFSIEDFLPNLKSSNQLSLLAAILLSLAGLEMSAAHAKEVKNPQKSYPKAILFSAIIILTIMILGALSIAIVTPSDQIQLASGSIQAFQSFFKAFDLNWALPILALLISIGSLGQVSTWTVGPTKGLLATANHGELPPFLQKVNKKNMPVTILSMQAITVTLLSAVFLFMPSVTSSYQLLLTLAAQLYLFMYIFMFITAIVLRYKKPSVKRAFKIPFNNTGLIFICLMGIFGCSFAILSGFIPPDEFSQNQTLKFIGFLIGGIGLFLVIPLIIYHLKKPHWQKITEASELPKKDKKQ